MDAISLLSLCLLLYGAYWLMHQHLYLSMPKRDIVTMLLVLALMGMLMHEVGRTTARFQCTQQCATLSSHLTDTIQRRKYEEDQ